MTTNSRHKLMDDAFRQWIRDLEDGELLREWAEVLKERIAYLDRVGAMTFDELADGFARCRVGERIFLMKRVRDRSGNLVDAVTFASWQPRAQRVWLRPADGGHAFSLDREKILFHQPARVDLATRRRAAIIKAERRLRG